MPLQDKSRPGRKVTARKIISSTGRIFDSAQQFAEEYDITVQTAYNIIRRKQVFRGMIFRYEHEPVTFDADSIPDFYTLYQKGGAEHGGRTEETNARGHNEENG
jgi:hypothetical protein